MASLVWEGLEDHLVWKNSGVDCVITAVGLNTASANITVLMTSPTRSVATVDERLSVHLTFCVTKNAIAAVIYRAQFPSMDPHQQIFLPPLMAPFSA